ncbi:MAG TPA: hypothetical protein VGK94_12230 [Candidatus Polarisedimenticolia bacterium]|jgi:hypothetical protein
MAAIVKDVTLMHRLQKSVEPVEVRLSARDQVRILREWESHYLIKTPDGKVFNIRKEYVDPAG